MVCMRITGWSERKNGVTIHESEEDDFRSEFHRNRNRKGFKDTRSKDNYSEIVCAKVSTIISLSFSDMIWLKKMAYIGMERK